MNSEDLAVVILNWNGRSLLERFLPSVIAHSKGAKIYVADNASSDDSVEFIKSAYPQVQIIRNERNEGFAGGYNLALKAVEEPIYCLLNSDVEVCEGWIQPILDCFAQDANLAIAQPKIKDLKRPTHFEYAGAAGGYLDRLGYPFCRGRIFQSLEKDEGQYDDIREIFWATGACLFVKKDVFRELGGFDPDYFAHQEEVDFCWRAHNAGYAVRYVGHSQVLHLGGSTLSNMNPRKTFLNFRNSLYSLLKNLRLRVSLVLIFTRLLLDGLAALVFFFEGKPRHSWAVLRAHLSFYRHFGSMFRKREKAQFTKKYYCTTSIVWSYYVSKTRAFNNLVKD
ncbi:hypothetical protein SAMN04490243_1960 [Robiginitalea myxolifaciens]|uniref:Glycosyltransferase 2-like domain-containing protein n=1 Tax=Robiginitalea myxolifaciens TaxID=400055 RepID=A0A1I6GZU6_9FLAO|nr:glycosyltransferase family 2 protein [Robiginitalea myxolifaciens]SFR47715.1 hypothetical protein SAMN04490243_1960 [Robiginitalea myxolifaciens]